MDSKEKVKQKSTKSRLQKRVRILAVITSLSVIITFTTIITSIVICLYYKKQSSEMEVFAEETAEDQNGEDEEAVEAVSGGIVYTQEEVDSMVTAAVTNAIDNADSELMQILQSRLENGDGTMTILRDLYPEHVVMLDSGQYYFLPLQEDLAMNTYIDENFIAEENGMVSYQEDGEVLTRKGIDVSKYQGEIDWEAVKNDGIDYAIIRVGIRGYSEGGILEDEFFRQNIEGAIANGIPVGVYFFTQAVNEVEAVEEASMVVSLIRDYELAYPVFIDTEGAGGEGRADSLSVERRTAVCEAFCTTVENAGFEAGVYASRNWYNKNLETAFLEDFVIWLAEYRSAPLYQGYYQMWQYTSKGSVNGISGNVDMNISYMGY